MAKSWAEDILDNVRFREQHVKDYEATKESISEIRAQLAAEILKQPLHWKGTVPDVSSLPSEGNEVGDMWNVSSTGNNYVWNGLEWDAMSGVLSLPEMTSSQMGIAKAGTDSIISEGAAVGKNTSGQLFVGTGSVSTPGVFKLGTGATIPNNGGLVGITQEGQLACRMGTDTLCGAVFVKSSNNTAAGYNSSSAKAALGDNCGMSVFAGQDPSNLSGGFYVGYSSRHNPSWTESLTRYQHDRIRVYGSTNGVYEDYFLRQDLGAENAIIRRKDEATTTSKGTVQLATSVDDEGATSVLTASKSKELLGTKADKTSLQKETEAREKADAESEARLDALEAKFPVLGLGWFKPDSSVEADATAGRLDDKRRILIGLDKTGRVVKLEYGAFGSDGLWHDTTGVYAGIYVKRWDHEKQEWKTPVPAPHATGKVYPENTLDRLGILPWAGIRDAVLDNEVNGVAFEQHVVKIPQFRFCKKYHATIRWKSEASDTGYVDETGELKIALAEPPAEAFSIGFDADGTGTGVVTLKPEDFPIHDAFVVPDGSGGTREIDHIAVAKYFGTQLNCGGTQVMTSRPVASRNSAQNRGQATQYCENGNLGKLGASYTEVNSTAAQIQLVVDLMEVEFATRDIQSVNTGATKYDATIGMDYTQEWQFCNAENLDDFERRGLEGVRASGWVDYYGKLKTEHDRTSDPAAPETQSTGKEFLTRFNWRGIEGGLFCSAAPFISDMEIMCWANEEIPASLISADFAQELVAAGVATEDAETGALTVVSGGCLIIAIRNPETPLSQIYRGTGSGASDRDNFVSNYVATGKYRIVELVAPTTSVSTRYFKNIPFGMEFAQKTSNGSDGNVHGVDYGWWDNKTIKMRGFFVGGSCIGELSSLGLRFVLASGYASYEHWQSGSRACFIPSPSEE